MTPGTSGIPAPAPGRLGPGVQRRWMLLLLITAASLILAAASLWRLRGAGQEADEAAQTLAQCRAVADELQAMRDRPRLAQAQERPLQELTRHIEQAAADAAMTIAHLVRIWPESARRLGDTAYLEKPTQVLLRDVDLEQLTRFLTAIATADPTLTIPTLRLTAIRKEDPSNRWTAEVSLSYLIYAPRTADDHAVAAR